MAAVRWYLSDIGLTWPVFKSAHARLGVNNPPKQSKTKFLVILQGGHFVAVMPKHGKGRACWKSRAWKPYRASPLKKVNSCADGGYVRFQLKLSSDAEIKCETCKQLQSAHHFNAEA